MAFNQKKYVADVKFSKENIIFVRKLMKKYISWKKALFF